MHKPQGNPCIRCGQERIIVKTWVERTETSVLKHTMANCPDPECQKLVDKLNAEREEKRQFHLRQKPRSVFARSQSAAAKSGAKKTAPAKTGKKKS